jgi:short-subunit dehydrogenase
MRMELAPKRIGVSVLCPALVKTALSSNSQKRRPSAATQAVAGAPSPISMERPVGMEPDVVAAATLSAIRANRLYVLTHPEYRPVVEQRMGRILHAFATGADRGYREDINFLAAGSLAMDT